MINVYFPQKIEIDTPKFDEDSWVKIIIQKVVLDENENVIEAHDRHDVIYKKLSSEAYTKLILQDPILELNKEVSVAGLANGIRDIVGTWIVEKYPGTKAFGGVIADAINS